MFAGLLIKILPSPAIAEKVHGNFFVNAVKIAISSMQSLTQDKLWAHDEWDF